MLQRTVIVTYAGRRDRLHGSRLMRPAVVLVGFLFLSGCGQDTECDSLLDCIRIELQKSNAQIVDIQVLDTKPKNTQYWLVARGITPGGEAEGSLENELFGIFVIDESFTHVIQAVDVFPTPRWRDYELWITTYDAERITVRGRGATYHDNATQKSYQVPL